MKGDCVKISVLDDFFFDVFVVVFGKIVKLIVGIRIVEVFYEFVVIGLFVLGFLEEGLVEIWII